MPRLAPILTQIEMASGSQAEVDLSDVPSLPRIWFVEPSGNKLIQIQRERFHHNWRKISPEDSYPRHRQVLDLFQERLATFRDFISENDLGVLQFKQHELTYVNHIPSGEGWESIADISKVFPDFSWKGLKKRFVSAPEGFHWKTIFTLPEEKGRLHVTIRNATRVSDGHSIILFELTARGIGKDSSSETIGPWFEMAHSQIVQTFADLVDEEFQKVVWGRKQ